MEYTIRDTFDVSADRFWEVFFSDEYNAGLWPALDVDYKLLKLERTGEGSSLRIIREQELTPHRQAPKVVQKMVKGTVSYIEKNDFDAAKSAINVVTVPNFAADRVENHGVFRVEALGENQCARIWEGVCKVKIPLVGGQVEKYLVSEIQESYRKTTEYTRKFLAENP
jgi:hypothetical protein